MDFFLSTSINPSGFIFLILNFYKVRDILSYRLRLARLIFFLYPICFESNGTKQNERKKKKAAWYFFHIYIEDELKALKILLTKILKINV